MGRDSFGQVSIMPPLPDGWELPCFPAHETAAVVPVCDCEEGPVTVHCGKCNVSACDDCDAGAHLKGARKAHVRIPIKEHLSAGGGVGEGAGEKASTCPIHKNYPITFFCTHNSCGITICAMCAAEGHKSHTYVKLSEASGTTRQALEKVVARSRSRSSRYLKASLQSTSGGKRLSRAQRRPTRKCSARTSKRKQASFPT